MSESVVAMAAVAESLHPNFKGWIDWKAFDRALARLVPHEHLVVDIASNGSVPLKPVRFTFPLLGIRKDYFGYYRERHPYYRLMREQFEPVVSTSFPFDPKVFYRSEFYQEFFRPLGFRHFAAVFLQPEFPGNFVLSRSARSRDFSTEDLEFLRLVRPVVIRAVRVAAALQALDHQARAAERAMGEAGYGVFRWKNHKLIPAHRLAEEMAPQLNSPAVSKALADAVREIESAGDPFAQARRAQDEWELRVARLDNHRALVLYRNEQTLLDARLAAVAPALRLTPREVEVTQQVCRGLSNAVIASRLHVTEDTVKQHLKSVFRKVDASSRSELIARLNLPAVVPGRRPSPER